MSTKVNAIKTIEDINRIKNYYHNRITTARNRDILSWEKHLLFFILGINTVYRGDELLNLKWSDIYDYDRLDVKGYVDYTGYKFYLNSSCKNALYDYISKYRKIESDVYIFAGLDEKPMSVESFRRVYKDIQKELALPYNINVLSLHKTFVYWQIVNGKNNYNRMSKLRYLLYPISRYDINDFAEYDIGNDFVYMNDVNL